MTGARRIFVAVQTLMLASLSLGVSLPVAAQTRQLVSVQVSGLGSLPFGGGLSGVASGAGFEAQIRFNPSAFSVGAGFEQTFHSVGGVANRDVTLTGGFVEPRFVIDIGSNRIAPYLSARIALSRTKIEDDTSLTTATGYTLNGGGGILVSVNSRANLDLGATIGFRDLGTDDSGTFDLGSGSNAIVRLGVAFGLGG